MTAPHHAFVRAAYDPRANAYVTSPVHANGEDLDLIAARVRGHSNARAIDLGCGGGHVCYRVAPHVAEVIAMDLSPQMLGVVLRTASDRGLKNIRTQEGAAESIPFPDGHFDFVLSRFSAHHWRDFERGLREARRVLAPTGRAILVDSTTPQTPLLDTHLQTMELLRDPSHVRNYTAHEWVASLSRAGFEVTSMQQRSLRIEFASWIARTRTPTVLTQAIQYLQQNAPEEVRNGLDIESDGSFRLEAVLFEASAGA
jgi:ubiquinone/menaquinone biosynthesis C-methylase UbiE